MKHFDVFLRRKVMETNLYIQELVQRKDLAGKDCMVLFSVEVLAHLHKYIAPQAAMKLTEQILPAPKTAYTTGKDKLLLSAAGKLSSTVFTGYIADELIFGSTSADALDTKYTGIKDRLRFASAPAGKMGTVKYLSSESAAIFMAAMNSALCLMQKFASAQSVSFLQSKLMAGNTVYLDIENNMTLFADHPTSRLARYRNLGETFPLTLGSMQDRTLEDLILEVIE